jgi:hypothetical protein
LFSGKAANPPRIFFKKQITSGIFALLRDAKVLGSPYNALVLRRRV